MMEGTKKCPYCGEEILAVRLPGETDQSWAFLFLWLISFVRKVFLLSFFVTKVHRPGNNFRCTEFKY